MAQRRARGEGSVFRVEGGWKARLRAGGRVIERRFKTQREALQELARWRRQLEEGSFPAASSPLTLGAYLEEWLESLLPSRRRTTVENYRFICRRYIIPRLGRVRLRELNAAQVERLLRELSSSGLSSSTLRLTRAVLRSALTRAVRLGLVEKNAAALASPPAGARRSPKPFTLEETLRLVEQAKGHRLEAAFLLGLLCGLRLGEVLGLSWEDVDLERGVVRVRRQLQRVKGEIILAEPKTESGKRAVPLPRAVKEALERRKVGQLEEQLRAGRLWKGNGEGLVFTSLVGTPLEPRNFTREFHKLQEAAGVPRRGFHASRHTAATILRGLGVPLADLKDLLGHSSVGVTADLYAHVTESVLRSAVSRWDEVLAGKA